MKPELEILGERIVPAHHLSPPPLQGWIELSIPSSPPQPPPKSDIPSTQWHSLIFCIWSANPQESCQLGWLTDKIVQDQIFKINVVFSDLGLFTNMTNDLNNML